MTGETEQAEVEKRGRGEDSSVSTTTSKKQKVDGYLENGVVTQQKVNPSELASAFALASLAGMGRFLGTNTAVQAPEKGDSMEGVQNTTSWEEARSPKADRRPPGSPRTPGTREEEPSTPESIDGNKRVHFAPSIEEQSPSTASALRAAQATQPSRRLVLPPHIQGNGGIMGGPRGPMPFGAFNAAAFRSPPHMPSHHPMHSPHAPYHQAPQPWFHSPAIAANMAGRMAYPPQRLMQPPLVHPENEWICDFCNVASFSRYEEACAHEEACKIRYVNGAPRGYAPYGMHPPHYHGIHSNSSLMSRSGSGEEQQMLEEGAVTPANSDTWHEGTLSLAMGESDAEWLSELNCFVRSYCVEAFSATEEDVSRSSKRGRIALKQVGIRCRYCVDAPSKDKACAAVSFPTSIGGIYESVKRWQRVHFEVCESVPQDVRNKLLALSNTNVWVPTTRQYWSDSAKAMGLVDTTEGIRFGIDPKEIRLRMSGDAIKLPMMPRRGMTPANEFERPVPQFSPLASGDASLRASGSMDEGSTPSFVVFQDDMEMIPPYVYFLMRQVEPCRFTEADRFVARSKGPVGYPGFQCRHCKGHAGLGKYFPVSAKSLSTNSTSQNIHAHLLKCRKCPEPVKERLIQLKIEKGRSPRLEPGWRKIFFDKVWERLHG